MSEETVETTDTGVAPVKQTVVTKAEPETVPVDPSVQPVEPVAPVGKGTPIVSDQDRDLFRQWLREDARWVAIELELHQTNVPVEERPVRNP